MTRPCISGAPLVAGCVLALTLTACGPGGAEETATATPAATSSAVEEPAEPASDEPFGEGCSAVPTEGEGSLQAMVDDPVVTAASSNPALSALVEAVTAAHLVDALDGAEDITVLAPADAAFEAVPADALEALLGDTPRLTAVLTHHVLEGRLAPDELAGEQTTLAGSTVTIEGSGEDLRIPAEGTVLGESPAGVICGNVRTANATVYIIDQVLMPPAG